MSTSSLVLLAEIADRFTPNGPKTEYLKCPLCARPNDRDHTNDCPLGVIVKVIPALRKAMKDLP